MADGSLPGGGLFGGTNFAQPDGWERITAESLRAVAPDADLDGYFDGIDPTWATVANNGLRFLSVGQKTFDAVVESKQTGRSSISILRAPSGEGKSTAIRQVVRSALLDGVFDTAFWCSPSAPPLTSDTWRTLVASSSSLLIAADGGEKHLTGLNTIINSGLLAPEADIHIVLASRDTDWSRACRQAHLHLDPVSRWRRHLTVNLPPFPGRVPLDDARLIAEAWSACAANPPSSVRNKSVEDIAKRIATLSGGQQRGEGALLGALLDLRFPEGLEAHLASLLERLTDSSVGNGKTLAHVLLALAAVSVARIDGLPRDVVAKYCGLPESNLRTDVEGPLGKEAVIGGAADALHVRHAKIGRGLVNVNVRHGSAVALETVLDDVLAATYELGRAQGFKTGYGQIFDIGRRITKARVGRDIAGTMSVIGIGRVRTAINLQPKDLNNYTTLSSVLRDAKNAPRAISDVWMAVGPTLGDRSRWNNWDSAVRGAWREMATSLDVAGHYADSVAAALVSLSDLCNPARIQGVDLEIGLIQLAYSSKALHLADPASPGGRLIAMTAAFYELLLPDAHRGIDYLRRYCQELSLPQETGSTADAYLEQLTATAEFVAPEVAGWLAEAIDIRTVRYSNLITSLVKRGMASEHVS